VKVIHQENGGVSKARNVGIENAIGKYICFSDPDDILKPDYVEYMVRLCEENNTEIGVCAEVFTTFMPTQRVANIQIVSGEDAAAQILYGKITIGCYSKIFRKSFLENNHIRFFENVYIGEGFNFNVLAFCKAPNVAVSQHKVYFYRLDNSSSAMSKFNIDKCTMGLEAIEVMRQRVPIKSKRLYDAIDYADWATHASMYDWMVMAKVKKVYPKMYDKCLRKTRMLSFKALSAPTSTKGKVMTVLRCIHPFLWAYLRICARRLAGVKSRILIIYRGGAIINGNLALPQTKMAA
jgi:glycosyltransferase involved in cell wall biosynthesis